MRTKGNLHPNVSPELVVIRFNKLITIDQKAAPARGRAELIPTSSPADPVAPRVDATCTRRSTLSRDGPPQDARRRGKIK
jgi:hypothetical protein